MRIHEPIAPEIFDPLLADVDKPARYIGGEVGSIRKDGPLRGRLALCFPDVYEVAESHLGLKILYNIVNDSSDFAAERVYALWPDLERRARAAGVPLWTLESRLPLGACDVVGFTLQYELAYATVVAMLDHGGVGIRTAQRAEAAPFVIGGGAGAFNPEPVAPFFDAFLLGDGETAILDIMEAVAEGRERGQPRAEILAELARIDGIYVPSHFEMDFDGISVTDIRATHPASRTHGKSRHGTPRVPRRTLDDLDSAPFPTRAIVPNVQPVHDRVAIEIQRGCSQACRFCQAGMITRPTRQRRPETVLRLADESLHASGSDALGLLSLSAGDYAPINSVLESFFSKYESERISISLPSMRTETMTPELARQVAKVRKSGFTFAPEAGSERMRNVINKTNSEEDLLSAVRSAVSAGWRQLKFYFMIGLPTETGDDVMAIAELGEKARREGRKIRPDVDVTVSVSTFIPKPHTAFQWEAQISEAETIAKHQMLRDRLKPQRIGFRYHSPQQSFLEGVLSRGDRRLASAIESAAQAGCRLDAWTDHYDHRRWIEELSRALAPHGLQPEDYLSERSEELLLPWDHLDAGILKKFLRRDRNRAYRQATINDCALTDHCYACGGCDLGDPYLKRRDADGARLVQLQPAVYEAPTEPLLSGSEAVVHGGDGQASAPARAATRSRLRFRFGKLGRAVHFSHLEMMAQILRAIRQAKIPVVYSQGHTPRPRVGFSPACPTSVESESEFFEADCHGRVDPQACAMMLRPWLPDGLVILQAERIAPGAPAVSEQISATTYSVRLPPHTDWKGVDARVSSFSSTDSMPVRVLRKKKVKVLDARASVRHVAVIGERLQLRIAAGQAATLKVSEALAAVLGTELGRGARIRKEAVELAHTPTRLPLPQLSSEQEAQAFDLTALTVTNWRQPKRQSSSKRTVPYAE